MDDRQIRTMIIQRPTYNVQSRRGPRLRECQLLSPWETLKVYAYKEQKPPPPDDQDEDLVIYVLFSTAMPPGYCSHSYCWWLERNIL